MNGWSDILSFSIISAVLALSVLGVWLTAIIPGIDRWNKRFFRSYFIVFILCCLFGLSEAAFYYYAFPDMAIRFLLFLECLLLALPMPMLTVYLMHSCGEKIRSSRLWHAVLGLWIVYIIVLSCAMFIDGFFVTQYGQYYRGPLYPVILLPPVAILLLTFAGTMRRRKMLSRKVLLGFLISLVPMTAALIAQLFIDVFPLLDVSYVLSALSMYGFVLSDQIEQDRLRQQELTRQQMEIADQRASIMVLQMRPHFIYNTMTSIYCLCDQNPQMARQVIMDFTTYLRKNFTAIGSADLIPFTAELEHVHAYLAVEQALYEDSLFVDYDTPHTLFRIPPLTLQPIVENAVKHGRNPYTGPLHISIRTRKTDSGSEIVVADNGRGFEPVDDSEPHIALKNIQQRLEILCQANLTIESNEGGGTVVTVTIPDSAAGCRDVEIE